MLEKLANLEQGPFGMTWKMRNNRDVFLGSSSFDPEEWPFMN